MLSNYKSLLQQVIELQKSSVAASRVSLHKRMTVLMVVFKDHEFRADFQQFNDFQLMEYLDSYVSDSNMSFGTLKQIFEDFPLRKEWKEIPLHKLRTMSADKRKRERASTQPKRSEAKPKVTQRDLADAERKARHEKALFVSTAQQREQQQQEAIETASQKVEHLSNKLGKEKSETSRLRAKVKELTNELAKAKAGESEWKAKYFALLNAQNRKQQSPAGVI